MSTQSKSKEIILLISTFIIAVCGLVYELLESTISSYLLGDSIYHFSLVIGLFMSSMGVGAWLSRFINDALERAFVVLQISIALIGGFSATILFYAFAYIHNYEPFLYLITILLGSMLGMEIPLIIRILKESFSLKTNISNVLSLDYIGALIAALLFPMVLVPQLGLMQTSFLFGMLNLFVGFMAWSIFRDRLNKSYLLITLLVATLLGFGMWKSNSIVSMIEKKLYQHNILFSQQTPYQKLIVTSDGKRVQFYINGAIQFDSIDEYRYHESLVHPVMQTAIKHENILIIGGGDGMALREVLKYDNVGEVTLVDLDPAVTKLFTNNEQLASLNHHSLSSPKLTIVNKDAWKYIDASSSLYDVIIVDLPDPNNLSIGRLYSETFYRILSSHLSRAGAMVTQSTSPMYSHKAFWCIDKTLQASKLLTTPYHTYIPSFGEWGFVMATKLKLPTRDMSQKMELHYIDKQTFTTMKIFAKDIAKVPVEINRLSSHKLIYYYDKGWGKWYAN